MNLKTILTIKNMSFNERFNRIKELCVIKISAHIPKKIRYWILIQEWSKASCLFPNREVGTIRMEEVIELNSSN